MHQQKKLMMRCISLKDKMSGHRHFYILALEYLHFFVRTGTSDVLPVLWVKLSGSGWLGYMTPYMTRNYIKHCKSHYPGGITSHLDGRPITWMNASRVRENMSSCARSSRIIVAAWLELICIANFYLIIDWLWHYNIHCEIINKVLIYLI